MTPAAMALVLYSTQVLGVVCAAALGAWLLHLSTPGVRLAYWRMVGVLCFVLPLVPASGPAHASYSVAFGIATPGRAAIEAIAPASSTPGVLLLTIWVAGVAICLLRLCLGAWGLGRLRRSSVPARLDPVADAMRREMAPRAVPRWSDHIRQPVTFGFHRPVVILPRQFAALSLDAGRSVLCHELLHVARGDWLWIVLEELVLALFWFHPGVWFVVDQIQLAREQVVDRMVVARTGSKTTYMAALMTFADSGSPRALAIAFLRHRHLKSRFQQLSRERYMSARRLVTTVAILAAALGATTLLAARTLPLDLRAAMQQVRGLPSLEIRLAERTPGPGLTGVTVAGSNQRIYLHEAALATQGDVTSARAVDMGGSFGVSVSFSGSASERMKQETAGHLGRPVAILLDGSVIAAPTVRSAISDGAWLTGITEETARALAGRLAPNQSAGAAQGDHKRVLPVPLTQVKPQYTPAAMDAKIEGTVLMEVVVRRDGSIGDVSIVRSLDTTYGLDEEAVKAMKQWTFKPGTVDGKPADVAVHVEMTFTLK